MFARKLGAERCPRGAPEQEEGTGRGGARKGGGGGAEGRERGAAAGVGPGRAHRGGGESTAREDTPGSPTSGTRGAPHDEPAGFHVADQGLLTGRVDGAR
ncbi:hypothetical protein THAOC_07015, partial [Thalassiosira oceanica]